MNQTSGKLNTGYKPPPCKIITDTLSILKSMPPKLTAWIEWDLVRVINNHPTLYRGGIEEAAFHTMWGAVMIH
jgi:hypothetical protein